MLRRLLNNLQSQADRRRIRFHQLRTNLCPICNSIIYLNTKDNTYKCRNNDCSFKESKEPFDTDLSHDIQ